MATYLESRVCLERFEPLGDRYVVAVMHRHLVVIQSRCVRHVLTADCTGTLFPWGSLPFLFDRFADFPLDTLSDPA